MTSNASLEQEKNPTPAKDNARIVTLGAALLSDAAKRTGRRHEP